LFDSVWANAKLVLKIKFGLKEICPEMHAVTKMAYLAKMPEMANKLQIVKNVSNEMAKGPFCKWQFWRKWQKWRTIAK